MNEPFTRRRVLSLCSGAAVCLAGCAEVARSVSDGSSSPGGSPSDDAGTATPTATVNRPTTTPGYKENHWHGRLFFEIDGRLVDFTAPKYHLDNIEGEEALGFHFHETSHGPNEWSNELAAVTLAEGLNLLPGIAYEQTGDGSHVVTYEGTTFREGDGTEITVHEGTREINPARHYVRHGEVFWLRIDTGAERPGPPSGHPDTRTGMLLIDVNNVRLDPSNAANREPEHDESTFHFHDDGDPYRWYIEGDGVTLADALNGLEGLSLRPASGGPDVSIEDLGGYGLGQPEKYVGTYRGGDDGTTITLRQRTTDVSPGYTVSDGDIVWIYVHTDQAPDNEH